MLRCAKRTMIRGQVGRWGAEASNCSFVTLGPTTATSWIIMTHVHGYLDPSKLEVMKQKSPFPLLFPFHIEARAGDDENCEERLPIQSRNRWSWASPLLEGTRLLKDNGKWRETGKFCKLPSSRTRLVPQYFRLSHQQIGFYRTLFQRRIDKCKS